MAGGGQTEDVVMPRHQFVIDLEHVDPPSLSSGSKIKIAAHLIPGICLVTPSLGEYIAWPHYCLKLMTTNFMTGAAVFVWHRPLMASLSESRMRSHIINISLSLLD
jgi:hypothetical protein